MMISTLKYCMSMSEYMKIGMISYMNCDNMVFDVGGCQIIRIMKDMNC